MDSEEWLESQMLMATDADRKRKAQELLNHWKQVELEAGKDVEHFDALFADLETFVAENKADLDRLLSEEAGVNEKDTNGNKGSKRDLNSISESNRDESNDVVMTAEEWN